MRVIIIFIFIHFSKGVFAETDGKFFQVLNDLKIFLTGPPPTEEMLNLHAQISDCIKLLNKKQDGLPSFCGDLGVGEKLIVDVPYFQSPTNVRMKYSLEQNSEGEFEIGINPFFYEELKKEELYTSDTQIRSKMNLKMKSCFETVGAMKFSRDKAIRFKIDPDAPVVTIENNIQHYHYRSHSLEYNQNIDCSTIIHEVFHLLGLPDEYHELGDYSGRIISRKENIMHSYRESFSRSHGYYILRGCKVRNRVSETGEKYSESRKLTNFLRKKIYSIGKSYEEVFEDYTKGYDIQDKMELQSEIEAYNKTTIKCQEFSSKKLILPLVDYDFEKGEYLEKATINLHKYRNLVVVDKVVRDDSSILREEQLNSILHPLCKEKNQAFYQCAKLAYTDIGFFEDKSEKCIELYKQDIDKLDIKTEVGEEFLFEPRKLENEKKMNNDSFLEPIKGLINRMEFLKSDGKKRPCRNRFDRFRRKDCAED